MASIDQQFSSELDGSLDALPNGIAAAKVERKRRNVLIVEDDDNLRFVLSMQLEAITNLNILTASDGHQALSMAVEHKPELLILDISLPDINAFEIIDRLRLQPGLCNSPLINHTSHDLMETDKQHLTLGRTLFITKTLACATLAQSVRNFLELPLEAHQA
jgi:CheY-like chemotaxis protein